MPNTLWIWDIQTLSLAGVMIHQKEIKAFSWSANSNVLFFCTGTNKLFIWTPKGASVTEMPRDNKFTNIRKIERLGKSNSMLLTDKVTLELFHGLMPFLSKLE